MVFYYVLREKNRILTGKLKLFLVRVTLTHSRTPIRSGRTANRRGRCNKDDGLCSLPLLVRAALRNRDVSGNSSPQPRHPDRQAALEVSPAHRNIYGISLPHRVMPPIKSARQPFVTRMNHSDQAFFEGRMPSVEFPTTDWSVVWVAADPAAQSADEALERLCRTYWPPVYRFIRHQGRGPDDALDLTQEFFARFLEKKHVHRADQERGRFRCFLLISIKHFLADELSYARTEKRGGGSLLVSLDAPNEAETLLLAQVVDPATPPDLAYEKQWGITLLYSTLSDLRQQSAATGGLEQFEAIADLAFGGSPARSQVEIAAQLGMTSNALGVAVHRLRRRYVDLLREAVAATVDNPAEIDGELRHLMAVISR